jgi:hypothetical protein
VVFSDVALSLPCGAIVVPALTPLSGNVRAVAAAPPPPPLPPAQPPSSVHPPTSTHAPSSWCSRGSKSKATNSAYSWGMRGAVFALSWCPHVPPPPRGTIHCTPLICRLSVAHVVHSVLCVRVVVVGSGVRSDLQFRDVRANAVLANAQHEFANNVVITSRYTVLNFVPKFLFEQFSRFVNLYFLYVHAFGVARVCLLYVNAVDLAPPFFILLRGLSPLPLVKVCHRPPMHSGHLHHRWRAHVHHFPGLCPAF